MRTMHGRGLLLAMIAVLAGCGGSVGGGLLPPGNQPDSGSSMADDTAPGPITIGDDGGPIGPDDSAPISIDAYPIEPDAYPVVDAYPFDPDTFVVVDAYPVYPETYPYDGSPLACPPYPPPPGAYCPVTGVTCQWPTTCGFIGSSYCFNNQWVGRSGACPPPPPPPQCPPPYAEPKQATPCQGPLKCVWPNTCGGTDFGYCPGTGATWQIQYGQCKQTCPTSEPKPGEGCASPGLYCNYTAPCGASVQAQCIPTPAGASWEVNVGTCPVVCPTAMPLTGQPCTTDVPQGCEWDDGCGGIARGYCAGGYWQVNAPPCLFGCTGSKPTSGTHCDGPVNGLFCSYLEPGKNGCINQCLCADNSQWACFTPPCYSADGGVPPPYPSPGPIPLP